MSKRNKTLLLDIISAVENITIPSGFNKTIKLSQLNINHHSLAQVSEHLSLLIDAGFVNAIHESAPFVTNRLDDKISDEQIDVDFTFYSPAITWTGYQYFHGDACMAVD